jgi:excisionase family DNA binding protein
MRTYSPDRQTLTIEEAAAVLGIDRSTAYALAAADQLPVPVIRRMVVSRAALDQVLGRTSETRHREDR